MKDQPKSAYTSVSIMLIGWFAVHVALFQMFDWRIILFAAGVELFFFGLWGSIVCIKPEEGGGRE
jgi:hypothetical protein